jgi:hypothetical protein
MSKATKPPPQSPPDLTKMSTNLRARTCAFLRVPPFDKLSPSEQVHVDVIGALQLEISDLREAQLAGRRDVDISRLVQAGEQLQRLLLPGVIENSAIAVDDARERMRQVLSRIAPEVVEASDREDETAERVERERLEAQEQPDEPPPRSDPPPAPPPPSNVQYLSTRRQPDGRPPAHYLKRDETFDAPPHWPLPKDHR